MQILKFFARVIRFINANFKTFVFLFIVLVVWAMMSDSENSQQPNLAKIYLKDAILDSKIIESQIKRVQETQGIKGALLVIDSPGGSVSASVEIADMIKELGEQMPVVAYAQGVMASGSYYAGMYAHEIFANRGALIGSIGVIMSGFNVEELLNTLGVKEQGVRAGKFKEAGTMTRAWSADEKAYLQEMVDETYNMFVGDVIAARAENLKTTDEQIFAQGRVFSAKTAKDLGLIDEVGSMSAAVEKLQNLSGVDEPIWLERDKIDVYLESLQMQMISKILALSSRRIW